MLGKKDMDGWLKLKGLAATKSPGKSLVETALSSLNTEDSVSPPASPTSMEHDVTAPASIPTEALSDLWSPEDDPHTTEHAADFGQNLAGGRSHHFRPSFQCPQHC
ncbi:MAG: hypothetical protein HC898_10980 [Phycisphaerales bacterium]|nr:hypothetical protein [Phycisphaerales bacterium]